MSITLQKIDEVSRLARLRLTPSEKKALADDLSVILDYVDQIKKIKIDSNLKINRPINLKNVTRIDQANVIQLEVKERLISQAPQTQGQYLKVKKIFEG
ncbi:MAG: Asp-tRNA(Asn)/Glu-tRNA(Gln) amidotransferase subunit GatC [Patescibacteria group bacterium]|jgi:aspartyl/glutamyl-tRNA(Asn/Gln) amidotransferase C subunit|nr:Asp-tRNA(Asn)/Glu-tRNA(Gln) amidotransferase subunit GatC [Patescibacteria group bacterium]